MDKFEVGEVCLYVGGARAEQEVIEHASPECVVVHIGTPGCGCGLDCVVRMQDGTQVCAFFTSLRKKKPPEDKIIRQETTDWNLCAWKPSHITV